MFSCFLKRYLSSKSILWEIISKEICWTFLTKCYQTDHLRHTPEHLQFSHLSSSTWAVPFYQHGASLPSSEIHWKQSYFHPQHSEHLAQVKSKGKQKQIWVMEWRWCIGHFEHFYNDIQNLYGKKISNTNQKNVTPPLPPPNTNAYNPEVT